jgi:hypothetical protein
MIRKVCQDECDGNCSTVRITEGKSRHGVAEILEFVRRFNRLFRDALWISAAAMLPGGRGFQVALDQLDQFGDPDEDGRMLRLLRFPLRPLKFRPRFVAVVPCQRSVVA